MTGPGKERTLVDKGNGPVHHATIDESMLTVSFTISGALRKSALREANERLVLDAIRRNPGISRAGIAEITGFARPSVTFVVNRLIQARLVEEEKLENGAHAGRPPTALRLRADAMTAIGVEIARTRSNVVLVDLNGTILRQQAVGWTPEPERFLDHIQAAIRAVAASRKQGRVLGVGVSVPGTVDKAGGRVVAAEALGWFGVEVGQLLRRRLKWPVLLENAANLSALAEQWYSSPAGDALRHFVYIRLQGGVGSGVVVDGRILQGSSSAGTEFGHVMLDPEGRPCSCGNRGCWEQYASDAALVRCYRELSGENFGGGDALDDSLEIVRLARAGDQRALKALETTASYLALGFINVIAALNPQAIIVGEPMASAWDLVKQVVEDVLRRRVPPYYLNGLRLLPSRTDTHSALRGAAVLALVRFFTGFDHAPQEPSRRGVALLAHG